MNKIEIKVKCFSLVRQETGVRELSMKFEPEINSDEFLQLFYEKYPELCGLPLRMAVNKEYIQKTIRLKNGDEIALIPPVSGG